MAKILVIEDESGIRDMLVDLLTMMNFQVVNAADGRSGIELAREFQPDLILCDIAMPDLDGFDVLYRLHQELDTAAIPFIFLTARVEQSDRRQARLLGADDYLTKPFSPDELLEAITTRLERYSTITQASIKRPLGKSAIQMAKEAELQRAIAESELVLYYQPQILLKTGQIVGLEALVRWQHPQRGTIAPSEFISLAEQSGLIIPLGEWALRTACQQLHFWHQIGFTDLKVAVNVSSLQLDQSNFYQQTADILAQTRLDHHFLELELTETAILKNVNASAAKLQALKDCGIQIAVDDFGTGYASLEYLQHLPFDTLKIDRCFVQFLDQNPKNRAIVSALIQMAHNLNLNVIAEGIETEGERNFLKQQGCDEAQGYFYSAPLPFFEIERLLEQRNRA